MLGRIAAGIGVRAGEGPMIRSLAALFAIIQAGHGLGANTADALFFLRFGVEFLPLMILASGPVLMLATLAYSRGLARVGAGKWLTPSLLGLSGLLLLERAGVAAGAPAIYAVIWLGAQTAILISYTVMWNAATEACTTRQAKRLFPLFASAGIAGGIVGNVLTGNLARSLGTENLLLIHAALLVAGAIVVTAFVRRFFRPAGPRLQVTLIQDLRSGLQATRDSPLLRLLAWLAIAFSILFFLVAFPFSEIVAGSFSTEADVASFLGLFSAGATALTFVVSLVGTNRLLAGIGVVATLLIVPLIYTAGFGLWLVSFGLMTASLVRGVQWVAVNALLGTAWNSVFNALAGPLRSHAMAFITAIPAQIGTMASGLLLLIGSELHPKSRLVIGLAVATICIALVVRMRRAYTQALVAAVQQGLGETMFAPIQGLHQKSVAVETVKALNTCLDDPRPGARVIAAQLLWRLPGQHPQLLTKALADEDSRVRRSALEGIATRSDANPVAQQLLGDPSPEVRQLATQILVDHNGTLGAFSARLLDDSDARVRATSARLVEPELGAPVLEKMLRSDDWHWVSAALDALAQSPGLARHDPVQFIRHPDRRVRASAAKCLVGRTDAMIVLREMLDDPSIQVRAAAAGTLAARSVTVPALFEVLENGSVRACDAALGALTEAGIEAPRIIGWISGEVDRARSLRFHAAALMTGSASDSLDYLRRLLVMRQRHLERWALIALRVPDFEKAMPLVRRGVWSLDEETRAQALEALDSAAHRSQVRSLIALLEDQPTLVAAGPRESLIALTSDRDEWIRALAARSLVEERPVELDTIRSVVDNDPSPLVRTSVSRWTSAPMQTAQTLDTMDRVLALQRVHMFSEIDAEDLERVADASSERRYSPAEIIYTLGARSDEMLVIVTGKVDVKRGDGSLIRTYQAGDHVGELALLRRSTRSADVVAGAEGVHALALGAQELEAILEERPEVAMAMLATLAERLGTM